MAQAVSELLQNGFSQADIAEAIRMSWKNGVLNYRRRRTQLYLKQMTERIKRYSLMIYWECTRRFGKSSEMLQMFDEHCRQQPGWRAGFFAPVKDGLKDYIEPIIEETFKDCPWDERPRFINMTLEYKNGSVIVFRGSNNKQHRVRRGQEFHEVGVDEGRDVDELDVLIDSVLMPSLFDKEGRLYLSSTPADTRSHPLFRYRQLAETQGWLIKITIWDANRMDPISYPLERIKIWQRQTLQSLDGDSKWKREFECEWVINASRAAVPEWNAGYIQELPRDLYYQFYQHYIGLDWGFKDFTAIVFGTRLFRQGKFFQEGELAFSGKEVRSDLLSTAISDHAEKLWGPGWSARQVADCADPIATQELNKYPNMNFVPVEKAHTLEAMLQEFRVLVNMGNWIVSGKCPLSLHCNANAVWDDKRSKLDQDVFARHFDHLMAQVYMARIVDWNSNPIPADYMIDGHRIIELNFDKKKTEGPGAALEQAFGRRGR